MARWEGERVPSSKATRHSMLAYVAEELPKKAEDKDGHLGLSSGLHTHT